MKTIIFYDFEATSVSKDADCISVGLVSVTKKIVSQTRTVNIKQIKDFEWEILHCFTKQEEEKTKRLLEYNNIDYKQGWTDKENLEECFFVFNDCLPTYNDIVKVREIFRVNQEIKTFYAEFTDFNIDKCDDWVKNNVVNKLNSKQPYWDSSTISTNVNGINEECYGYKDTIKRNLKCWLSQFEEIEFWADYDVIDKPMLIDLIADWEYTTDYKLFEKLKHEFLEYVEFDENYFNEEFPKIKIGLPKHLPNIKYDQFFDLHTMFKLKGVDTDINREKFAGIVEGEMLPIELQDIRDLSKHNALFDAHVSWLCYNKLMQKW